MYTKGIRKIFETNLITGLEVAQNQAIECGFKLLSFNGNIYSADVRNQWTLTSLRIEDFEV